VYMEIQLYQSEHEDYLLDFGWSGYKFVESTWECESSGQEGVHSVAFFLDLANLITAVARGGHRLLRVVFYVFARELHSSVHVRRIRRPIHNSKATPSFSQSHVILAV